MLGVAELCRHTVWPHGEGVTNDQGALCGPWRCSDVAMYSSISCPLCLEEGVPQQPSTCSRLQGLMRVPSHQRAKNRRGVKSDSGFPGNLPKAQGLLANPLGYV